MVTQDPHAEAAVNKLHPLQHYRFVKHKSASWPKVLLDPDATFGHHVHDALNLPGFMGVRMDKACIRVLHLQNLFKKRWHSSRYYDLMTEPVDAFHWVFDQPAVLESSHQ
jgi:hypothetical protein